MDTNNSGYVEVFTREEREALKSKINLIIIFEWLNIFTFGIASIGCLIIAIIILINKKPKEKESDINIACILAIFCYSIFGIIPLILFYNIKQRL